MFDGHMDALSHIRDPAEIPFAEREADYACESTGVFLATEGAAVPDSRCQESRVFRARRGRFAHQQVWPHEGLRDEHLCSDGIAVDSGRLIEERQAHWPNGVGQHHLLTDECRQSYGHSNS